MTKIDFEAVPVHNGSRYPEPYDAPCTARRWQALGLAGGLTQFGVNRVVLEPGSWSSQRHWHAREDEFVYVLEGELVLVTDDGEATLRPGDCAAFKAGVCNGHHLQNRSGSDAVFLAIGSRDEEDWGEYSDIDMVFRPGRYRSGGRYAHRDGRPYPPRT